jgi:hypothetical protein
VFIPVSRANGCDPLTKLPNPQEVDLIEMAKVRGIDLSKFKKLRRGAGVRHARRGMILVVCLSDDFERKPKAVEIVDDNSKPVLVQSEERLRCERICIQNSSARSWWPGP